MTESGEHSPIRETISIREITGPIWIDREKNFYQQFPFEDILREEAERSGVSLEDLRYLFSNYLSKLSLEYGLLKSERESLERLRHINIRNLIPYKRRAQYETSQPASALKGVLGQLEEGGYPFWREYIWAKRHLTHRAGGEPRHHPTPTDEPTCRKLMEVEEQSKENGESFLPRELHVPVEIY